MEYIVHPILVAVVGAAIGATVFAYNQWRSQIGTLSAFLVFGAIAGIIGSALFTAPLSYCMFEQERTNEDLIIGWILMIFGLILTLNIVGSILQRYVKGEGIIPRGDTTPGAFKGRFALVGAALVLSPTILVLIFFVYLPMYDTLRLSTLLARFGAPRSRFVCVDNFSRLITDTNYHQNLMLTFVLGAGIIVFAMSISLLVATLLNTSIRGANVYRTLLIWPFAISPVVTGALFSLILSNESGIVNHFLDNAFGFKVPWLVSPREAQYSVVLASVWNVIGANILYYTAGLQTIPKDLLEAASIDGANAWQRFQRITFPLLAPFTFFLIVTNTIYALFQTFDLIFVLTRGGPLEATSTAMFRIYVTGILGGDLGKSSAQSLVLFLIVIGVTVLQFRLGNRRINYGNY